MPPPPPPPPIVQDPHSENEIDAKIQQQLVFKIYISELFKLFAISLFIYKSFRDTKLTKINAKIKHIIIQERFVAFNPLWKKWYNLPINVSIHNLNKS